jgi:hypothetical protein
MTVTRDIPVAELATFTAGDFTDEWCSPEWLGTLEPNPHAGETMRYMIARYAYHVNTCGGGASTRECVTACDAHSSEMRAGGPLQHIQLLARDMRENGWDGDPIDVDLAHRQLDDGHHRILAALMAGLETVPVIDYCATDADSLFSHRA